MRILVTNDDGITRPGIAALARALALDGHEVRVVAPARERSGSSSSLGTVADDARIRVAEFTFDELANVVAHQIDGTPALAVRAVCTGSFGWMPEFVVSGINPGLNTGRVVLHSGTVGAALTAASCDITGLAVSTATENAEALATAGVLAAWLVDLVAQREFGPAALSLNVPALSLPHVDGVSDARLSDIGISDVSFDINHDVLRVRRKENSPPFEDGTDAYLLSQGWAVLSAIASPWASAPDASGLASALHHRLVQDRLLKNASSGQLEHGELVGPFDDPDELLSSLHTED